MSFLELTTEGFDGVLALNSRAVYAPSAPAS
jgi:hypothetical protein